MRKRTLLATTAAAVVLAGAGGTAVAFADGHDPQDAAASGSTVRVSGGASDAAQLKASKITAQEAAKAAAAKGRVASVELDAEHGGLVWEADVRGKDGHWYEVTVDAGNGKVLASHADHDDGDDKDGGADD